MKRETRHLPVLLNAVLRAVDPKPGQTIVDCTLGLGGHSAELLRRIQPGGRLIGIDFDAANIAIAREKLTAVVPVVPTGLQSRERPAETAGTTSGCAGGRERPAETAGTTSGCAGGRERPAETAGTTLARTGVREESAGSGGITFSLFNNNFAALPTVMREAGVERVDAVLADLGVASPQIDDPSRGFSYRTDGPLDMRMNRSRGEPASALIARLSEREMRESFLEFGDEDEAPQIARLIVERRAITPITTTQQLAEIICEARDFTMKRAAGAKLHPAARTFQALRILVNREMANLERLLAVLPDCLNENGVAAIISFHSGEDRRVKEAFREGFRAGLYSQITSEPILASEEEVQENARSRSAKLRWARRARREDT